MEQNNTPVILTRRQEIWKFFQFLLFSISAGIIETIIFTLLKEVVHVKEYNMAYIPALVTSVLWNFTINRKFTFKSVSNVPVAMMKIAFYYAIFAPLSGWWSDRLVNLEIGINTELLDFMVFLGTIIINFITEFCVYRFWVYRTSINSSEAGKREQEREKKREKEREKELEQRQKLEQNQNPSQNPDQEPSQEQKNAVYLNTSEFERSSVE